MVVKLCLGVVDMKYIDYYKDIMNIKPNTILWACAYDEDNNYEYSHLRQEPIKGIVVSNEGEYSVKLWSDKVFMRLVRNDKPVKSSAVSLSARKYADTYEECVEIYNSLIDNRINHLKEAIKKSESDKINV